MTLKEDLKPLATKYQFSFLIAGMDDAEIIEFIIEELFNDAPIKGLSFAETRALCTDHLEFIDSLMPQADQHVLFDLLKKYC
jgi:DNA-binding ferritin-like protein (Dps family)